jgi:hypothetical protein
MSAHRIDERLSGVDKHLMHRSKASSNAAERGWCERARHLRARSSRRHRASV